MKIGGKKTSSRLSHRVVLQEEVRSSDGGGGYDTSWQDVATIWAEIEPVFIESQRGESFSHGQIQAISRHIVTVRYRDNVKPDMRLLFGARVLNIRHVANVSEAKIWLRLYVEEGVAD